MMAFPIRAIVRRHMSATGRFVENDIPGDVMHRDAVLRDEQVIGSYVNPAPWEQSVIVFTDSAVYSLDHAAPVRLLYDDICGYEFPASKEHATGALVRARHGDVFFRVAGTRGPVIRDVFDFISVIRKIAGHNQRNAP
jgi:hypothetical protein